MTGRSIGGDSTILSWDPGSKHKEMLDIADAWAPTHTGQALVTSLKSMNKVPPNGLCWRGKQAINGLATLGPPNVPCCKVVDDRPP